MVIRVLGMGLVLLAAAASGCDSAGPGSEPQVVVSAVFEVGRPLGTVRLTRTAPLEAVYDPVAAGVTGATVRLSVLAADGSVVRTVPYEEWSGPDQAPGTYLSSEAGPFSAAVEPQTRYRLEIEAPLNGETRRLTAEMTTPAPVELVQGVPPVVTYGEGRGPEARIRTASTAGRRAVYLLTVRALQPSRFERVTVDGAVRYRSLDAPPAAYLPVPIARTFADCAEEAGGALLCESNPLDDFASGSSPLLNEDSYELLPDGTAIVRTPFLAFGFYGPQEVAIYSMNEALVDFIETQAIQFIPTTLSPGEIPNVTTNVEGGLGVFGAYAGVTVRTFLQAP